MMSAAVTGPIPSIVSSCSTVAVPRLIGPSAVGGGGGGAGAAARGHDDLLAVGEPGGEVDRVEDRRAGRAAGALDGVGHPGAGGQPVDARAAHRAGDVDDDVLSGAPAAAGQRDHLGRSRLATAPGLRPSAERIARVPSSSRATASAP